MFSRSDWIAVLSFSAKFKDACYMKYVPKVAVMSIFQFYLTGKAVVLVEARMTGCSMAMNRHHHEFFCTYKEVIQFLLRNYITVVMIVMAYSEFEKFKQISSII